MQPSMRSALSRRYVKSGSTRSMPGISRSGNMSPQSSSMIRPSTSMQAQLRPISPSPPRKTIRTGLGNGVDAEVAQQPLGLVLEPVGRRSQRQAALPGREAQHPEDGFGGNGVGRGVTGLEGPRRYEPGVDGPGAGHVALGERGHHLGGQLAAPVGGDA